MKKLFITVMALPVLNALAQITPANNKIAVDVSTFPQNSSSYNYDSCFTTGAALGMQQTGIYQNWTAIETSPGTFNFTMLDIANLYYPLANMPLDLTLTPIHTNNLVVPSDLTSASFSSTVMINRFNRLLDSVKNHIPNITLSSLVIGSEHDVYIGSNAALWGDYTTFYNAVSAHAKALWPGLKVATEITFGGLVNYNAYVQVLNANSDYIGVSYYPLTAGFTVKPVSTVPVDFATLVGLYPSKPICFYQYGYPSGPLCISSDALQAQFITQTFLSWDTYAANIRMIDFTWLHDLDPAQVSVIAGYYGGSSPAFLEFLRTLGLRSWNGSGSDKLALNELRCQAKQRGYNNLALSCQATGIAKSGINDHHLHLFPNPASDFIRLSSDLGEADLYLYTIDGKLVKRILKADLTDYVMPVQELKAGVYELVVKSRGEELRRKMAVAD